MAGATVSIWKQIPGGVGKNSQWGEDWSQHWQPESLEEERQSKRKEESKDLKSKEKTRSLNGASPKGDEVVVRGKFMGRKVSLAASSL